MYKCKHESPNFVNFLNGLYLKRESLQSLTTFVTYLIVLKLKFCTDVPCGLIGKLTKLWPSDLERDFRPILTFH